VAKLLSIQEHHEEDEVLPMPQSSQIALSSAVPQRTQQQLVRMFRDPYVLAKDERNVLIHDLRDALAASPYTVELHILLGMALCVDFQVQEAMELLRVAVKIDPDNFLVHLKYGELLMRLRICDQASDETRKAAMLAANPVQSELARRQAATLRTMLRDGIERGGYNGILSRIAGLLRKGRTESPTREMTSVSH
jgi:predicted Zn-dependent protease